MPDDRVRVTVRDRQTGRERERERESEVVVVGHAHGSVAHWCRPNLLQGNTRSLLILTLVASLASEPMNMSVQSVHMHFLHVLSVCAQDPAEEDTEMKEAIGRASLSFVSKFPVACFAQQAAAPASSEEVPVQDAGHARDMLGLGSRASRYSQLVQQNGCSVQGCGFPGFPSRFAASGGTIAQHSSTFLVA